jgi:hypothetical protein
MYGNYVKGSIDVDRDAYSLLVSGEPSGYHQSSIMIGGDTSTTYGLSIVKTSANNGMVDLRGNQSNSITFRHKNQTTNVITNMIQLSNDSSLTGNGFGAIINGRMNASSYYIGSVDTRSPNIPGVYSYMDQDHIGNFVINKGKNST